MTHKTPLISVVVCTYDRPAYLQKCLTSLVAQTLPAEQVEVLVVDNGQKPRTTAEMVAHFASIRPIRAPEIGLAKARNIGWQAARTDLVAYIDDDAVAEPQWLETICNLFATEENIGCAGGPIRPIWEAPRPQWLTDELAHGLSLVDWGDRPCDLAADQWIPGCNMAFPRSLLAQVGGFPEQLGRTGQRLLSMEETVVHDALRQLGHRLVYHPSAAVHHHIPIGRMRQRWFVRRAFWNGISRARYDRARLNQAQCRNKLRYALRHKLLRRDILTSLLHKDNLYERAVFTGWLGYCGALV